MLFIAMVGFVATSCSKTIVKDEVETAISFSTESGKLTRAIVQNDPDPNKVNGGVYFTNQPFGVFAYSHQKDAQGQVIVNNTTPVMKNQEIFYDETSDPKAWRASGDVKYYWPNDPNTSIDFYAFSPACSTALKTGALKSHQQLNGAVTHSEADGFKLQDFSHANNMYIDFMLATPVIGATFTNPSGNTTPITTEVNGTVPLTFNHKLTQIVFNVSTDVVYKGVTFTVEEITLKNIVSNGTYTYNSQGNEEWLAATTPAKSEYTIFPANDQNGGALVNPYTESDGVKTENSVSLTYTENDQQPLLMNTTGVTMIPQTMAKCTTAYVAGQDNIANERVAQVFKIKYSISGKGVAKETVTKHIAFNASDADQNKIVHWNINQRITYKVKIGLNEITFEPSVADWDDTAGNTYDFKQ